MNIEDVKPLTLPATVGWRISDFRLSTGRHNGSRSALYWAKLAPGDTHHKHRHDNYEMVYYVIRGQGLAGAGADRVEVRGGHSHRIPQGVEHFLVNLGKSEPLEVIGALVGAGSLADAGYVYTGDVSAADLAARTA